MLFLSVSYEFLCFFLRTSTLSNGVCDDGERLRQRTPLRPSA